MTPEELQGYIVILAPLAMAIVAMSIFTLQDKKIKTYTLFDITKDRNVHHKTFDKQGMLKYTEGDNT